MTAGEHEHCFCTEDTGGRIICCKCRLPLEDLYDKPELVLMWEKLGHKRDEIVNEEKVKQGKLL